MLVTFKLYYCLPTLIGNAGKLSNENGHESFDKRIHLQEPNVVF